MRYPTTRELKAYSSTTSTFEEHKKLFQEIEALHSVEQKKVEQSIVKSASLPIQVASWNMERGRYGNRASQLLKTTGAQIILLTEMDIGMARTGQINTIKDLAERMDGGYVFGTEFVELSLGDCTEQEEYRGIENHHGLHGNGIISKVPLLDVGLVRMEQSGKWFVSPWQGQLRIGGRMALTARVSLDTGDLVLAAVHIESHSDPTDRRNQVEILLNAIDERFGKETPVLIGGDFNTNTLPNRSDYSDALKRDLLIDEPTRFLKPELHEPIFSLMEERGYRWQDCNVEAKSTQRIKKHSQEVVMHKLDWFFCRNLQVKEPKIVSAVDGFGELLSDHEILTVTVSSL